MKVLMVGPERNVHGGISSVINNYYNAGLSNLVELKYIGTMAEGSKIFKLYKALISYVHFLFIMWRYDIIHINMASNASYYRKRYFILTAKILGKKLIIHQHGGDFEGFYRHQSCLRKKESIKRCLNKADLFIVFTSGFKEFFSEMVEEKKIRILPNAIGLPKAFHKDYKNRNILFLGRLCKEKGICELINAVETLHIKYPDIHLYLGGIWEDQSLMEMIKGKNEYITWLGWLNSEQKQKYLAACSVFSLPSYFEGQPISVLEGMAAYCTCVVSDAGGIPYMIENNKTGVLVQPKNQGSLEHGLERVLVNEMLRRELGQCAREKAEKDFEMSSNVRKLLSFYREVWYN